MAKRSREILALILLFVLVIAGLVAIVAYLTVGHSWNVAATNIDDSVGSMSGYTVFAYEGTLPDDEADEEERAGQEPATSLSSSATASSSSSSSTSAITTFDDVVSDYLDKEASVVALDLAHPETYEEPLVIVRNGSRIGIFSVTDDSTAIGIDKTLNYFQTLNVDYVLAISYLTPSDDDDDAQKASDSSSSSSSQASSSSSAASSSSASSESSTAASATTAVTLHDYLLSVSGVDIVLDTVRADYTTRGVNRAGKFIVSAPVMNTAGIILVSPSNVVSSKTVDLD